jgi:hypothetical protein
VWLPSTTKPQWQQTVAVQVTVRSSIVFEWLSISDINNCPFAEVFLSIRKGVGFGEPRGHSQQ